MSINEEEVIDSRIDEEPVDEVIDDSTQDEPEDLQETINALKEEKEALLKEKETLLAQKNHFKKKATAPKETKETNLNQSDFLALVRNNVHEEDVEDIVDYAKLKGISIREALNSPIVKTIIGDKQEARKTAETASVKTSRRGQAGLSDEELLANASKGIIPESASDIQRLNKLRWANK
jgi:hypothetical protein